MAKHFHDLLPTHARGVLAVLSARVGSIGDNRQGGWYSYRASKAALNQLWHTAAIEIARKRREAVLVALQPGTVRSALTAPVIGAEAPEESVRRMLAVIDRLSPAAPWDRNEPARDLRSRPAYRLSRRIRPTLRAPQRRALRTGRAGP